MAWIEKRTRGDGGVSARVVWRLEGTRNGAYQAETFSAGSDAQNLASADGFKKMVDAAGQRWPDGWVKGEGFVRPAGTDPLTAPPGSSTWARSTSARSSTSHRVSGSGIWGISTCSPALRCAAR